MTNLIATVLLEGRSLRGKCIPTAARANLALKRQLIVN
jgi:hypothetical protein